MLYSPLSVLSDRTIMRIIMDVEMDLENMNNEVAILHMVWRFWVGIRVFGDRTREEAAGPAIGYLINSTVPGVSVTSSNG